jgi:tRNA (guanine37-N1)-methyltransferase
MSARGQPWRQDWARQIAGGPGLIVVCGRFEGVDQRVVEARDLEEVSVGDAVTAGGEAPAMVVLESILRLLPGVVGAQASTIEESFEDGLLEAPHYTRPRVWEDRVIPDVLTSGHHGRVAAWRREQGEAVTRERRPDLWQRYLETGRTDGKGRT